MKYFYITTTLPYVNADPHIGFALEIIQADTIARFYNNRKYTVFFNTGTDEHGQKIYNKAIESNKEPQNYVNEYALKFDQLKTELNLSYNNFIRTTDTNHKQAAQEFWNKCLQNGDIYKSNYSVKYCVGCELEKTDSELIEGKCPIHPNLEIQNIQEENYFFKFSKYQQPLLDFYNQNPKFVVPDFRFNEIKNFVNNGLQDFSISRLKEKMPWGVPVPNDDSQVMYVWFDALVNYISALNWPNSELFTNYWPGIQIAGKDNLRQQSAMWQAMLMSAGVKNSKQIIIHGFMTVDGQKMSKSLGNVINPIEIAQKYGSEALRYYLLKEIPTFEDGDYSEKALIKLYNADLANGIGNLISRLTKLCESTNVEYQIDIKKDSQLESKLEDLINEYNLNDICRLFEERVAGINKELQIKKPWENVKESTKYLEQILNKTINLVDSFSFILPKTDYEIKKELKITKNTQKIKIKHLANLFPRIK